MRKLIVAAIAGACLVVPALAGAHEDRANAVDHITCGDGTILKAPFSAPVCKDHGTIARLTCANGTTLTPPLDGKRCAKREAEKATPQAGDDLRPGTYGNEDKGDKHARKHGVDHGDRHGDKAWPRSTFAFPNRVWRLKGNADGYADGVLDFTAKGFLGLGARSATNGRHRGGLAIDTRVLVTAKTRVYDADKHRLTGDAAATALDGADKVVVFAKLVPKAKWLKDEDDELVPTLRAKRIIVKD